MRETHLRYLLAAALVVVAGYGVYTAAPQSGDSLRSTGTTPVGTPTQPIPISTTAKPSEQLAPGVTWNGVVDPWNLSHAHANTLLNNSFRISTVETQWTSSGSNSSRSMGYVRAEAGGSPLHSTFEVSADAELEIWREANASYTRYDSGNETKFRRAPRANDRLAGPITSWDAIYTLFASVNTTTVEQVNRNGTVRYRVVSTSQPPQELFTNRRSNYSLSALVAPNGLVYRYQEIYDLHSGGRTLHVSRTWRLSNLGSTTVTEPAWVDEARNATTSR